MSICVCVSELSSTLMEKMQSRDLLLGLQLPELDELGQFIRSLPTSALVGLGAITAVLAYWFATRPRAIIPPCDLRHQSQEVEVGQVFRHRLSQIFSSYEAQLQ